MKENFDIAVRKPIWLALSELYLDTQLQEPDFRRIASIILASPYRLEEVQQINQQEVFPILLPNLLHIAGEWASFEENWLVERITQSLEKRNAWKTWWLEVEYLACGWIQKADWERLEQIYQKMNQKD